jgi:hypothetical protein
VGNVLSFNKQTSYASKKKEPKQVQTNESYYFRTFEGATFSFGGAFVRDLLSKIANHQTEIKGLLTDIYTDSIKIMPFVANLSDTEKEILANLINTSKLLVENVLDELKTPESFDEAMSERATLKLMPMLLLCIILRYYSNFDIHRMIKQNWLQIDISVDEFFASQLCASFLI